MGRRLAMAEPSRDGGAFRAETARLYSPAVSAGVEIERPCRPEKKKPPTGAETGGRRGGCLEGEKSVRKFPQEELGIAFSSRLVRGVRSTLSLTSSREGVTHWRKNNELAGNRGYFGSQKF